MSQTQRLQQDNLVKARKKIFLFFGMSFAYSALAGMVIKTFFPDLQFLMLTPIPDFINQFFGAIPIISGLFKTFEGILQIAYGFVIFSIPFMFLYLIFSSKAKDYLSLRGGSVVDAKKLRKRMLLHDDLVIEHKATKSDVEKKKNIYEFEWGNEQIPLDPSEISRGMLIVAKAGAGKTVAINNLIHGNIREIFKSKIYKKLFTIYDNLDESDDFKRNTLKRFMNILPSFMTKIKRVQTSRGVKEFNRPMIFLERKGDDFAPKLLHRDLLNKNHFLFDPLDEDTILWNFMDEAIDKKTGKVDTGLLFFMVKILYPADEKDHFAAQAQMAIYLVIILIAFSDRPTMKHLIDYLQSHQDVMSLRKSLIRNKDINRLGLKGTAEAIFTIDEETGGPDGQARGVQSSMGRFIGKICLPEFYFEEGTFTIKGFFEKLDKIEDYEKYKNMRLGIQNEAKLAGKYNLYYGLFFALIFKIGLAMEQRESRKIMILLDEVQSFAEGDNKPLAKAILEAADAFLAEARSRGFFTVIATQSIARLMEIAGDKTINSLFQLLSAKLIMQYDEPLGAKFICDYFGEEEVEEKNESESAGTEMNSTKASTSIQRRMNKKILTSELTDLAKKTGFFKQGDRPVTKLSFGINSGKDISVKRIEKDIPEAFDLNDIEAYKNSDMILDYADEIIRVFEKIQKEGTEINLDILSAETKLSRKILFNISDEDKRVKDVINEVYKVSTVIKFIEYTKDADKEMSWNNFKDYCDVTLDDLKDLSNKYKKVSDFYKNLVFYKDELLEDLNDFTRQREIIDLYVRDKTSSIQDYSDNLIVEKLTDKFDKLSKEEILTYLFDLRREEVVQKGSFIKEHYINFDFVKALNTIKEESAKPATPNSFSKVEKKAAEQQEQEVPNVEVMNHPDEPLVPEVEVMNAPDEPLEVPEAIEQVQSTNEPTEEFNDFSEDIDFGDLDLGDLDLEQDEPNFN
ncbi:type IV secretion system DNA-binding domain-containing protein [Poseidonibacter ostreae]|uniref:Type IV secretion system DNA-binding domain-containing protein n=1 Tax=Poseidonibacter ostreae TaxID=2654171 RepID=A0A6L4WWF3_9BACT|nr:type IV secretion system DNA-binding domain-containing protein [Poseidonibacter ostreae]KAB7889547.1 type IV secretion system DNA-binding domain-containing protein [Poseidonibacter ostreae]